jgi:hypothetical protein
MDIRAGLVEEDAEGNFTLSDGTPIPSNRPLFMSMHDYVVHKLLDNYRTKYWTVIRYVAPLF